MLLLYIIKSRTEHPSLGIITTDIDIFNYFIFYYINPLTVYGVIALFLFAMDVASLRVKHKFIFIHMTFLEHINRLEFGF